MKFFARALLMSAVAVLAIAISVAPSEAAKKKKTKAAAAAAPAAVAAPMAPTGCNDAALCASNCNGATCTVNFCGVDHQWHPSLLTPFCVQGNCPPRC